jgi:hypothetical protein
MTLQEQLRKLTTGGPGVADIASETLFEEAAAALDQFEALKEKHRSMAVAQCKAEAKLLMKNGELLVRLCELEAWKTAPRDEPHEWLHD